ncbi:MAG: division/cell wall cluster transcriptional repressor MraZ [Methylococcaceae bacterium]|nr:division/cell wall cluster transcriptional repressor MraZ [Methylococcaceae bacterium]
MFRGVSSVSMDAKGRLAIPTRYRAELSDCCSGQLVVTVAVDETGSGEAGCLWLYPLPEWESLEEKISKLPTLNKMAGRLRRFVIGYATECEMDGQGRLLLSENLRSFAKLEKQVVLLGQLNKFEIWNESIWTAKENEWLLSDEDNATEELAAISF